MKDQEILSTKLYLYYGAADILLFSFFSPTLYAKRLKQYLWFLFILRTLLMELPSVESALMDGVITALNLERSDEKFCVAGFFGDRWSNDSLSVLTPFTLKKAADFLFLIFYLLIYLLFDWPVYNWLIELVNKLIWVGPRVYSYENNTV